MENGSNPDPNTRCRKIKWKTVRIRIQTHNARNNLDNGSNPDPNTKWKIIWNTVRIRIQKLVPTDGVQDTIFKTKPCLKWTLKRDTVQVYRKRVVLTWVVGIELNCALVVRQLPVELAYGYHAFSPILRKGFGSRGQGVADDPLVQLLTWLNIKKYRC